MTKKLNPGDHHYRHYIGHGHVYDKAGAAQFNLLTTLGLREHHRILDVGCGSLRLGRLLIPWLLPYKYVGIEPNTWLVKDGFNANLSLDIDPDLNDGMGLKQSKFYSVKNMDISKWEKDDPFDYIIAHSVFTHCGDTALLTGIRNLSKVLKENAIMLASFKIRDRSSHKSGWHYPGVCHHTWNFISSIAERYSLHWKALPWGTPGKQQYIIFSKTLKSFPSKEFIDCLIGKTFIKPDTLI